MPNPIAKENIPSRLAEIANKNYMATKKKAHHGKASTATGANGNDDNAKGTANAVNDTTTTKAATNTNINTSAMKDTKGDANAVAIPKGKDNNHHPTIDKEKERCTIPCQQTNGSNQTKDWSVLPIQGDLIYCVMNSYLCAVE